MKKTETLTFIGNFKNSINRRSDRSETYEIKREKPNDEDSRVLALRKFGDGRLEMANQDLYVVESEISSAESPSDA
jgi:hypothetical protein